MNDSEGGKMRQVTSSTYAVKVEGGKVKPFRVSTVKQVNGDKFMLVDGKEVPCRVIESCIQTLVSAHLQSNIIQDLKLLCTTEKSGLL